LAEETKTKKKFRDRLSAAWPEVWSLVRPRLGLLAGGFLLMIVNRVAGLVLPWSPKVVDLRRTRRYRFARRHFLRADAVAFKGRSTSHCGAS
jgi:hypothetical protein